MKIVLAVVGTVMGLDALVAALMIALWLARGHVPDFIAATIFGAWSVATVALKTAGGTAAAIQLWRLKPSGRLIAGIVLANNVLFTLAAAARAGIFNGTVWATVALHTAMLVVVLLPAAARACQGPRPFRVRTTRSSSPVR